MMHPWPWALGSIAWPGPNGPWAQTGPGPKQAQGPIRPGSKWAQGPNGPWAQMGPGPKCYLGPNGLWAQMGFGPNGPWAQMGPGPKCALGPMGPGTEWMGRAATCRLHPYPWPPTQKGPSIRICLGRMEPRTVPGAKFYVPGPKGPLRAAAHADCLLEETLRSRHTQ